MLEATLRDRLKYLLTPSARSDVPPFMVMDVMAAAARIEAAGGHVIHMEVGQPAAPVPKAAISAAHAARGGGGGRVPPAARAPRAVRMRPLRGLPPRGPPAAPATTATLTAVRWTPSGSWSPRGP